MDAVEGQLEGVQGKLDGANLKSGALGDAMESNSGRAVTSLSGLDTAAGKTEGLLGKLGNTANTMGIPFGNVFLAMRDHMKKTETSSKSLGDQLLGASRLTAVAGVAGFVAAGASAVKMATDFQASAGQIAASANISVKAGQNIANSFLTTGGETEFTAEQMAQSYENVAGQLGLMQGHALNASQALGFMRTSATLAEASHSNLASTTKNLAGVMQSFQLPTKDAAKTADQLFNASRATGVNLNQLTSTIDRLHSRMGITTPSVGSMSTMLIDLAEHSVTGSRGLMIMNSSMNTLVTAATGMSAAQGKAADANAAKVAKAQDTVNKVNEQAVLSQQKTSDAIAAAQVKVTAADTTGTKSQQASANAALARAQEAAANQAAQAQIKLAGAETNLQKAQSAGATVHNATMQGMIDLGLHVFDTQGKFVGFGSIIQQLYPHLKGLNQEQQLTMLGSIGLKTQGKALLDTFAAGPAAWDKAAAAVARHGTAQKAAEARTSNLKGEEEKLRSAIADLGVEFGQKLLPILTKVAAELAKGIGWVTKHKDVLYALLAAIGAVITVGLISFAVNMTKAFVDSTAKALRSIGQLIPGIKKVPDATKEMESATKDAAKAMENAATKMEELMDTLEEGFRQLATVADESFGQVGEAAETAATVSDSAMEEMATTTEAAAVETDAAIGSTGIGAILIGLGLAITLLLTHWKQVWGAIKTAAVDAWHFIYGDVLKPIEGAFKAVVDFIKSHWKLLLAILLAPIAPVIGAWLLFHKQIIDMVNDVINFFKELPGKIISAITSLINLSDSFWASVGTHITNAVGAVIGWFTGLPKKIIAAVGSLLSDMEKFGEEIVKRIVKGMGNLAGDVGRGFKSIVSHVPVVGGLLSGILGEGGVVTKPGLYVVGESEPEIVIPASKMPHGLGDIGGPGATPLPTFGAAAGAAAGGQPGGAPNTVQTIYAIENLVVVSNNPQDMANKLQQQARLGSLSAKPQGTVNLGVAS